MIRLLNGMRGAAALLGIGLWFVPGGLVMRFFVLPACFLWPKHRVSLVSQFMQTISYGILFCLRAGGARFHRQGVVPTGEPALVVMNHQSLVDIPTAIVMSKPYAPAFVTRKLYAWFIPLISPSIRLLGCPIVDPKRDPRGAVAAVARAAEELRHAILIFPEGHRTLDGEIQPFRPAGLTAIFKARRFPVYLLVTDGAGQSPKLVDFVFNMSKIRSRTEMLGPFLSPEPGDDAAPFIAFLRETMVAHLGEMRRREHAAV